MINLFQLKTTDTPLDNHYRLIDKIGGGGFSEVWLAEDLRSQVTVALKVYSSVGDMDEEGVKMFRKEFSLVCNLNHTNILKPFTFDIYQGCPYIVLPYCEKGSAAQYVGKMTESELWDFVRQVAAGLAYIHKHNIIHQDIKPGNVLVNADGQMMITDFGISTGLRKTMRRSVNKTDGSPRDGTIAYMSYECLKENPVNVMARDIWAFGATVYELVTGEVPFGEYGGITQRANGGKVPQVKACVSHDLKNLMKCCLAMEPWDRPSAEKLVELVEQHKKGNVPQKWNWKKGVGMVAAVVLVPAGFFVFQKQFPPYQKESVAKVIQSNPDDSILLARVDEAMRLVNREERKDLERRDEQQLCSAAKMYKNAIIELDATDTVVMKVNDTWRSSQKVIDETYNYLYNKSVEYSRAGAMSAAGKFEQRCQTLIDYISRPISESRQKKSQAHENKSKLEESVPRRGMNKEKEGSSMLEPMLEPMLEHEEPNISEKSAILDI